MSSKSTEILTKAADLVAGERDRQHGAKADNFRRIAIMWRAYFLAAFGTDLPLEAWHVGEIMSLMKKARKLSGAFNPDDDVDDCGYAACAGELRAPQQGVPPTGPFFFHGEGR